MTPPETAPDHVARAQAIHAEIARWKPVLEGQGVPVTLELINYRNLAGVVFGVTVKGTLPEARRKADLLKAAARAQGFELDGGVIELEWLRDDLPLDHYRIGLSCLMLRPRAPRRKAA